MQSFTKKLGIPSTPVVSLFLNFLDEQIIFVSVDSFRAMRVWFIDEVGISSFNWVYIVENKSAKPWTVNLLFSYVISPNLVQAGILGELFLAYTNEQNFLGSL